MKLIELYKDILAVGSLRVDDEGMVSAAVAGSTTPYMVEGKRLVLPTPQQMSNADWSNRVSFHPLQENILRGESKVMEKYRNAVNIRLNYVIGMIAQELMGLAVDVAAHKRLNPDQAILLSHLKDADEKSMAVFQSLMKAMGIGNKDRCFVHIFLKRGGVVQGKKYNRACIVSFPLYEELLKDEKQVYGVTMSKKHKAVIRALIEFILPGIDQPGHFDAGSESDIAPFLDCLMHGVMKVASCVNDVLANYEQFIDRADEYRYNDDWVEAFDNLAALLPEIRMIPMQAGNEGSVAKTPGQVAQAPQQLTNVAPPTSIATMPHPVHAAHPPAGAVAMPQVQPTAPGWAPATPTTGPVRTPDGKIDMGATLRSNPQVAAAMGATPFGAYPGMMMAPPAGPVGARMGAPRWDNPGVMGAMPGQWPQQPQMGMGMPMNMGGYMPGRI